MKSALSRGSARWAVLLAATWMMTLTAVSPAEAAPNVVRVVSDASGQKLTVDGSDLMVFGMNWGYMPIGQNYTYSLWVQSDDVIEEALAREMPLLQAMGVNVLRQYVGIPARWIEYIYERYGIYTVLNHACARYGFSLDGVWNPNVDYADPRLREAVKAEVVAMVEEMKDTPGLLMWLLGNENNYGLAWTSFEAEALPDHEHDTARARPLYSMFGEIIDAVKEVDSNHPVAIANGDVQYIDLIAEECTGLDVFGTNVYRGISVRDLYSVVDEKLGVPVMFTEFGADAYNAKMMREDQVMQCRYLVGQWQEIYEQSHGKGRVGNSIGGLIFQWSDGWWKFGQETRLDIHDTNASWPNGGYAEDYVEGENNMNEEWWGICAKGPADDRLLYYVYPRAAYFALQDAFELDPYAAGTTLTTIREHFASIRPTEAEMLARGNRAAMKASTVEKIRITGLEAKLETYSTGGANIVSPRGANRFQKMQSFYATAEARPSENVIASVSVNAVADVPINPMDEIFYENRPTTSLGTVDGAPAEIVKIPSLRVYRSSLSWIDRWFRLEGFYRTGHYHWGYEGDFFGLYRDAFYGENLDIYNGLAPIGFEIYGRRSLDGVVLAFGPQLWWGANPAVMGRLNKRIAGLDATLVFHEDIEGQTEIVTSSVVPQPETRKVALGLATTKGKFGFEVGGIWAGDPLVDETFPVAVENEDGSYGIFSDRVKDSDTFGGKAKITFQSGRWHWYAQAARMGLVAEGGPTQTITYTGWHLKDSGSGNQNNFLTGLAINIGRFQFAPNFLWQKPIVGPMPNDLESPGRKRNILIDPFVVRANREMTAGELLITYDPTPATWMWHWDSIVREDAPFAGSIGFVYRDMPTTLDAAIFVSRDGELFPFSRSTPPRQLWEIHGRIISKISPSSRFVMNFFGGTGEPNGDSQRKVKRFGGDARLALGSTVVEASVKVDDWGPYDYHRDFNNTFPLQLMGDLSQRLGNSRWFGFPQTKVGVRAAWRSLDGNSGERYVPELGSTDNGEEWEIRSYLHFAM